MVKTVCASCNRLRLNKSVKSNKNKHPKWLDKINYVEQFIDRYTNFNDKHPDKYDNTIRIKIGKNMTDKNMQSRKILFWAAKPDDNHNFIIKDAKQAYGNFSNSGVATIDKNGYVNIKFITPQNYYTTAKSNKLPKTYYRHIHYVISNKYNTKWNSQIWTRIITKDYNYNQFIDKLHSNKCVVLNVLPCQYYAKDSIPGTYNLPYNTIGKMTVLELVKWFTDIIKLHYKTLYKLVKNNQLNIMDIPIICYCAHSKCDASKIANRLLMKKQFVNVNHYSGGMQEYRQKNKL